MKGNWNTPGIQEDAARQELAELIDSNWFITAPPGVPRFPPTWDFQRELQSLSNSALRLLLQVHTARLGVAGELTRVKAEDFVSLRRNRTVRLDGVQVSLENLVTTLKLGMPKGDSREFHGLPILRNSAEDWPVI